MFFTDPSMFNSYHTLNFSIGHSPTIASSVSGGIEYKHNRFRKEVGVFARTMQRLNDSTRVQSLYEHNHLALFLKYSGNTLNSNLFPTRGNLFEVETKLFFNNRLKLHQPPPKDEIGTEFYHLLNPVNYADSASAYNPILQFRINEKALFPLSRKLSLRLHTFAGFNFVVGNAAVSAKHTNNYMFLSQKFNLGGYHGYLFDEQIPFPGFSVNELKINNITSVTLGAQWNFRKKLYVTPNVGMSASLSDLVFTKSPDDFFLFWGTGIDFDYMSLLGPMKFSINYMWPKTDIFFSLGYQF